MKSRRAIKRQISQLEAAHKSILYMSADMQNINIKSVINSFLEWLDRQILASYVEKAKIEDDNRSTPQAL